MWRGKNQGCVGGSSYYSSFRRRAPPSSGKCWSTRQAWHLSADEQRSSRGSWQCADRTISGVRGARRRGLAAFGFSPSTPNSPNMVLYESFILLCNLKPHSDRISFNLHFSEVAVRMWRIHPQLVLLGHVLRHTPTSTFARWKLKDVLPTMGLTGIKNEINVQ